MWRAIRDLTLHSFERQALLNNWFMLERALSSYVARGKFGEHERTVGVARDNSRGQP